jgi:outer membrane murein-binding lipoprotein Lpp
MIRTVGLLAGAATLSASGLAGATDIDSASIDALRAELSELRAQNESLEARVDAKDDAWLNETRTTEIRGIVQDVLADSQTRTSLQDSGAMAGYKAGQGFFLSSADGSFSMRVSGQVQARWVFSHVGDNTSEAGPNFGQNKNDWGFQVRRAKVKFQGNVIDKTWRYQVNGDFMQDGNGMFMLQDAMITHDVNDNLSITFGRYKVPFLREELVSSSNQLAVERSLVNEYFNADRATGVDVMYKTDAWSLEGAFNNGAQTAYTANGSGTGTPYTNSADNPTKWAVQGRFQYKLSGDWSDFDSFTSSPDDENAMMIGVAAMAQSYNGNSGNNTFPNDAAANNSARQLADSTSMWGVTADFSAKFAGFSIFAAAVYQNFETSGTSAATPGGVVTVPDNSVNPWGFVGQAGYSLNNQWEVFGRFSWANNKGLVLGDTGTGVAPAEGNPDAKLALLTLGVNYFINDNVKFTADWGINMNNSLSGDWVNQADTGWRETNTSSEWVLRAQVQLLF